MWLPPLGGLAQQVEWYVLISLRARSGSGGGSNRCPQAADQHGRNTSGCARVVTGKVGIAASRRPHHRAERDAERESPECTSRRSTARPVRNLEARDLGERNDPILAGPALEQPQAVRFHAINNTQIDGTILRRHHPDMRPRGEELTMRDRGRRNP